MPCYHPLSAHLPYKGGKAIFGGHLPPNIKLPCGRCIGCRLERSKQWAIRLMHEAQLHKENSFITLTYANEHLPPQRGNLRFPTPLPQREVAQQPNDNEPRAKETHAQDVSLTKRDAQLFMKRLRKLRGSATIKYYLVGEYGDRTFRPHYHAALFGEGFTADRYAAGKSPAGEQLYRSPTLEKLWPYGHSSIGELTFESAAYIARYIMKKINGKQAEEHYKRVSPDGEVYYLLPEFNLMSRGGRNGKGIAHGWWEKYGTDVYPHDYVIMNGAKHKPPRYYDEQLKLEDHELAVLLKLEREFSARSKAADNTPSRLAAKEKVALARLNQSKRTLR